MKAAEDLITSVHGKSGTILADPLIEACSRSPFLELFARERRKGWTVWGNEAPEVGNRFNGKTNGGNYATPPQPAHVGNLAFNF